MDSAANPNRGLYRRIWQQVVPYWPGVLAILLFNLLTVPLSLLAPLPVKIAIDSVISGAAIPERIDWLVPKFVTADTATLLVFAVLLLVAISLGNYLNGVCIWLVQTYVGQQIVMNFRSRLFRHAQRLSLKYHDSVGTSDAIYRIQYDAPSIQWIAIDSVMPLAASLFTVIGMLVVLWNMEPTLMYVALTITPILLLLTHLAGKRLRNQWTEVRESDSAATGVVQEALTALRVVKAFGQEEREHRRFMNRSQQAVRGQMRVAVTNGIFDLLLGLTVAAGTAMVIYLGVKLVQAPPVPGKDPFTVGDLYVVIAYVSQLYAPLQSMSKKITDLAGSVAGAERALALLDQEIDVDDRPNARAVSRARGELEFRSVSFSYDAQHPVLHDVSVRIPAGTKVGIVGHTGAGKSTFVSLIMRFYDPSGGQVLLDGVDLRDYKLEDLRNQFSIVLQEPVLLSSTIAENIAYAKPDATQDQIVAAAKAANADGFITNMPEGYQTQVGERGLRLSGGERQRVSLARAFLRNSPMLILDEPTSAVDVRTEEAIIDATERLMAGRTTFMIAHRLSTLKSCDLILELSHGRLIAVRHRGDPDFLQLTPRLTPTDQAPDKATA